MHDQTYTKVPMEKRSSLKLLTAIILCTKCSVAKSTVMRLLLYDVYSASYICLKLKSEAVCVLAVPTKKCRVQRDSRIDLALSLPSHKAIYLRPLNPNSWLYSPFLPLSTVLEQFHRILETIGPRVLILAGKYSNKTQSLVAKVHFDTKIDH